MSSYAHTNIRPIDAVECQITCRQISTLTHANTQPNAWSCSGLCLAETTTSHQFAQYVCTALHLMACHPHSDHCTQLLFTKTQLQHKKFTGNKMHGHLWALERWIEFKILALCSCFTSLWYAEPMPSMWTHKPSKWISKAFSSGALLAVEWRHQLWFTAHYLKAY